MKKKHKENHFISRMSNFIKVLLGIMILLGLGVLFFTFLPGLKEASLGSNQEEAHLQDVKQQKREGQTLEKPQIINGKDVETGLLAADGLLMVKANCTGCHSSKLIIQNRLSRKEWQEKIAWMQETQGLWDLGAHETVILDYLEKNYGPRPRGGRRAPLENIEWYELEN
jgi:hypothetical protein